MLEAMYSFVPVVASNLHGIRDYIHKSCVFEIGDFDKCFSILDRLKKDKVFFRQVLSYNYKVLAKKASYNLFLSSLKRIFRSTF
jgi:hypothetical protein